MSEMHKTVPDWELFKTPFSITGHLGWDTQLVIQFNMLILEGYTTHLIALYMLIIDNWYWNFAILSIPFEIWFHKAR